jgi:hypothetical protein
MERETRTELATFSLEVGTQLKIKTKCDHGYAF